MRAYLLAPSLVPLCLLVGCGLISIDPDEIDIADTDEIGDAGEDTEETGDGDGDTGSTGESTTDTGFDTDTGEETEGNNDFEDDATDDSDADETTDDTSDTASDTDTTDDGTETTTGGLDCENLPVETECEICVAEACCTELLACLGNEVCACTFTCLAEGQDPNDCAVLCGEPNDEVTELGECSAMSCGDQCL
jgi:hypothetical protein